MDEAKGSPGDPTPEKCGMKVPEFMPDTRSIIMRRAVMGSLGRSKATLEKLSNAKFAPNRIDPIPAILETLAVLLENDALIMDRLLTLSGEPKQLNLTIKEQPKEKANGRGGLVAV